MPQIPPPADAHRALLRGAGATAIAMGLALTAGAYALAERGGLGPAFVPKVVAVFAVGVALVLAALRGHLPRQRFGPANQVTLARVALAALLAGLLGEDAAPPQGWPIVAVATLAAALDAADGALARRTGLGSAFGARFDMETDAFLILVLALLAWQLGKAGDWIVAAGLLRYVFVGASRAWRWLARPLPPSRRRQAICVVQIATLVACLVPIVPPPASAAIAGGGLALLLYSFTIDVAWLRHRAGDALLETA